MVLYLGPGLGGILWPSSDIVRGSGQRRGLRTNGLEAWTVPSFMFRDQLILSTRN